MKALLRRIRQILKDRRTRQMLTRIISVTAAVVVFVTTYALVLPAITMEAEAQCGIPAHQHDDSCYSEELVCGEVESPVHHHGESCYSTSTVLVCETEEHAHSVENGCYDENGNLICEKIEHVHSEENGCYEEVRELTCGLEESEGHQHDENCYKKVLTCGLEPHTHSAACYKSDAASKAATDNAAVASTESAAVVVTEASTDGVSDDAGVADDTGAMASTGATAVAEGDSYVPVLDELDFHTLLNKNTGIYYSRPAAPTDGTDGSADGVDTDGVDAETTDNVDMESAWSRIDKHTELTESDTLRLYLAYTVPAGSLNATNPTARYRLPGNITLTDEQLEQTNGTVNGIANQYVNLDTLEILDYDKYQASLGIEAVEGTRTPDQDVQEYLKDLEKVGKDATEFISATVKIENVYDEVSGKYLGQDLVFSFTQYTVEKIQHEYDADGQPTKAGEEVSGWLAIDVTTDQIDWISTVGGETGKDQKQTAEIVFVEKDKELGLKEISTAMTLVPASDESTDEDENEKIPADAEGGSEAGGEATTVDTQLGESEEVEQEEQATYPAISFDDSSTVTAWALSTDTDAVESVDNRTEITVHVEADENTFPEGTTMVLSAVSDDQMTTVAEAVEGAVDVQKTNGFHAVDISFRNSVGDEIEPLKPIRVSMTSDAIKRAVEDESTAPVVVHITDAGSCDSATADAPADGEQDTSAAAAVDNGVENADETVQDEPDRASDEEEMVTPPTAMVVEAATGALEGAGEGDVASDTLTFTAGSFSVYAIVYTVDLQYDPKTGTLSYEDNKIKVTLSTINKEKNAFPEKAVLIVREIIPEDAEAADLYARALTALSSALQEEDFSYSGVKVYDFSILDLDGNEIEPNGEVSVKIEYKQRPELGSDDSSVSDIQIAHLVKDPSNEESLSVEFMVADVDATGLGTVSGAEFNTDSFSAYVVFGRNGISTNEPMDLGNYGWIKFYTAGQQDTSDNQTADPDSATIQWGYYKNDGSNLPSLNDPRAYRRILKVRLWLPNGGQNSGVYDSDHYNEVATAQYFWVWQNEVTVEEFELPGYEVVHTRMHTAWDEENGRDPVENDSLVGSYAVRGFRRSTLSDEPGSKNSDLNVLDIYAKPLPQTTGMNYIIRYVHADGSVTDGNVRGLSSGSVTYNASQYKRDGEVYAGTSIVTGSEAINANTANGTGTITYNSNVSLAKVYIYYKIDPAGNGNPNTKGRYDKDENGYYTGAKGLYTDKSAETVSGNDRQFILNLESWYVDNAASVGMVLDSSGSMAWTSGEPEPIVLTDAQVAEVRRANGMWQDQWGRWQGDSDIYFNGGTNDAAGNPPNTGQYITSFSALSKILDKTKTDNSAMGYNGYHYYLKDMRGTVREYVALGYSDGNQSNGETLGRTNDTVYTTQIGNTSYSATVLANRFIKNENNAHGDNEGWYYVNSTGNTKAYYKYTGKSGVLINLWYLHSYLQQL